MTRRCWVFALIFAAAGAGADGPAVEFIHLSDTHVADFGEAATELALERGAFRGAARSLAGFFDVFSDAGSPLPRPAFFLITGDMVDAFRFAGRDGRMAGQVAAFGRAVSHSPAPVYLALGNHDVMDVGLAGGEIAPDLTHAREARSAWRAAQSCFRNGTYYTFEKRAGAAVYAFLVLDNGEGLDARQLQWLRREAARNARRTVILAMHVPLRDGGSSRAVQSAVAGARVALVLAGHNHANGVDDIALGRGKAVQARTAAFGERASNWRRIRLLEDRIEVFAAGRPDRIERTVAP